MGKGWLQEWILLELLQGWPPLATTLLVNNVTVLTVTVTLRHENKCSSHARGDMWGAPLM